ncbi:WXG100 family type VII secretion target, partial [Jatrophihabitans sp.]|uniref:WXG100 family type VII secretion target n=1 Tax=Jatrophihabitans sp. TaxID=1932789 RepID=UPI002EF15238
MATSRFELPGDGLLAAQVCLAQRMPAGDPPLLRSAARRSGGWAADLRRITSTLLARAETPMWSGAAHRTFVEHIRAHAPLMSATADRYENYAGALNAYAGALDETAPRLFATRSRLRQRYDALASRAGAAVSFEATALPAPGAAGLLPIACEFKAGYDRWADALDRCIRALSESDEADPTREVHGFSALGHRLARAAGTCLSPFERAVLHPSLDNISDCLSSLNLALTVLGVGLLFICPPAGTACLAAATVLAAA